MQDAAEHIVNHLADLSREDLLKDKLRQQAVALNPLVIGEVATKLLSEHADSLSRYPDIEWKAVKGMRNRIACGYDDLDHDVVWYTA